MTTSNIHIGLANWVTAHSYSIGNRVKSGTNAYQAISAGTSGVTAPTGTGTSISDGVVNWKYLSAIDFTSVQAWGNAIPATLTSSMIGLLWNNALITTTDQVPFLTLGTSGSPRNVGSFSITLTCAAGESFRDKLKGVNTALNASVSNGVCFQLPSAGVGSINYFDIYDSKVTFDGLQFVDPYSTSNCTIVNVNAATVFTLQNCIIDGYGQEGGAAMVAAQIIHVANSLIVDRTAAGVGGVAVQTGAASPGSTVVNSTFVRINKDTGVEFSTGVLADDQPTLVRNSLFVGYTYPVGGNGNAALVEYCVTDATAVGFATDNGHNTFSITPANEFVSATTNFRLKAGATSVNGGLTDLTNIPLSNDILGYTRPQGVSWSRGASEFSAQITAKVSIGTIRLVAALATANNAALTRSIGAISSLIAAQQSDLTVALVTIGTFSVSAISSQSNITTLAKSIGTISLIAAIAPATNNIAAIVSLVPVAGATIVSSISISATGSLGPLSVLSAASPVQALAGGGSIIVSATATTSFSTNASATLNLAISPIITISQSIVNASAVLTIPIVAIASALQYSNASATVSLGAITPLASALQVDLANASGSLVITGSGNLRQEAYASALRTIAISVIATAGQFNRFSTQTTIGPIAITSAANLSYIVTATVSLGAITASSAGMQSNELGVTKPIGAISANAAMTNPIPATAKATIVVSSVATIGFLNAISAVVSIGPLVLIASSESLLSGQASFAISALGTATNPMPLTAQPSIGTISTFNAVLTNLSAIPVTATISLPSIASLGSTAAQYALGSALISLVVSARAAVTNAPRLRVSQLPTEVLTAGGALHVSQAAIEVASRGGALRVSQTTIEVLTQSALPSAARVTQVISEVLANGTPRALASQVVQEVLTGGAALQNVRMTQVLTEVLVGGATTQNIIITQVVMETLISAVPLKAISTTYIAV